MADEDSGRVNFCGCPHTVDAGRPQPFREETEPDDHQRTK